MVILACFTLLGAVVKKGPEWLAQMSATRMAVRKADADDRRDLNARVEHLERQAQRDRSNLVFITNALTLALNALESENPRNPAIAQARELVGMAVAADDGFGDALRRLATIKGVGE
ncbi:hypothetical protein [Stakelama pacifica]|nr:hypothetical protein [Stakelama pacifica]